MRNFGSSVSIKFVFLDCRLPNERTVAMADVRSTSRTPLLLFHGLLSSPREFGLIAPHLRMRGITFENVTVPGYSSDHEPSADSWERWRRSASEVVEQRVPPDAPVVLGGLCTGGFLAAAVAVESRRPVAGLVLISPTFAYDGWGLSPIRHLRHLGYWTGLDRFFRVAEREPFGVKSPQVRRWIAREFQERDHSAVGPARLPLRALREAEALGRNVRRHLPRLTCPLLFVHAREDEITRVASVERVVAGLPQRDKSLAILEDSYHMVTIDNDRLELVALLERFVRRAEARPDPELPARARRVA
ncbi:MAG: alpha/beta fold hydrolase [Betaproteobacteria bacterium]|nr:alpha/beta fold hydrolase [Betaproteobacteria bacterium]